MKGSLTPQRVIAILKAAGFEVSKTSTTAVKGWHNRTSGFSATMNYPRDGSIRVSYRTGSYQTDKDLQLKKTDSMRQVLIDAGLNVEMTVDSFGSYLRVWQS